MRRSCNWIAWASLAASFFTLSHTQEAPIYWQTVRVEDLCLIVPLDWYDSTPSLQAEREDLQGITLVACWSSMPHPDTPESPATILFVLRVEEEALTEAIVTAEDDHILLDRWEAPVGGEPGVWSVYGSADPEGTIWFAYARSPRPDGLHLVLVAGGPSPTSLPDWAVREMLLSVAPCPTSFPAPSAIRAEPSDPIRFILRVDMDLDGWDEVVISLSARGSPGFTDPGDLLVFAPPTLHGSSASLRQVFACRQSLPEDLLPGFFEASVVAVGDIDEDAPPEVVLVWLEQSWWPTAYRPLAVLQSTGSGYEMIIDKKRSVSEIGDYAVVDLDDDGRMEILEIEAVRGEVIHEDGTEEPECHWCPHRYSVQVLAFTGIAFIPDERFNEGDPMITEKKYPPGLGDTAVGTFLPDLIAFARSHLK